MPPPRRHRLPATETVERSCAVRRYGERVVFCARDVFKQTSVKSKGRGQSQTHGGKSGQRRLSLPLRRVSRATLAVH